MNHAFLVEAHTQPKVLEMLISRLQADNHYFFIHIDKKADIKPFEYIVNEYPHCYFTERRIKCYWGGFSQIQVMLLLIETARNSNIHFDYYHTVSGQDYSLVNATDFDTYFDGKTIFMEELNVDRENRTHWYYLNDYYNRCSKSIYSRLTSFLERGFLFLQRIYESVFHIRLRPSIPFKHYKGSNWWSLTDDAIDSIITFLHENPYFYNRFRFTSCCDEVFFQTIIFNSPLVNNVNVNNLRFTHWSENVNPDVLTTKHYDDIIKSKRIIIRKISLPESLDLLHKLEDQSIRTGDVSKRDQADGKEVKKITFSAEAGFPS